MRTLGIDLSANPLKTGVCAIDWDAGLIDLLPRPVSDGALVDAISQADFTGIDVPLGWPDDFVRAISAHHGLSPWPSMDAASAGARRPLRYRLTDRVAEEAGARPLSVSSDLIGVPTMRAARIQQLLRDAGIAVDRAGTTGRIAEVYPAAALRFWEMRSTGYKGKVNATTCRALATALAERCGPLSEVVTRCLEGCDDDGLDALVCAVVARAVRLGRTTSPSADQLPLARLEGWIHIPTTPLETIIAG